jgi:HAE1 family hydrophobic/amphiphilic exporter-1
MQRLAEICIQRPVFAVMLIMALVVVGAFSYTKLGVDRFPDVDLPIVSVRTTLLGASPEEIESTVTRRIEDAVATVEGIENIRSTSTESLSIVTITFDLERNIDIAAQDTRDAVAGVLSLLPRDTKPPLIKKLDPDASPIVSLVLSGSKTSRELYELADRDEPASFGRDLGVHEYVWQSGGNGRRDPRRLPGDHDRQLGAAVLHRCRRYCCCRPGDGLRSVSSAIGVRAGREGPCRSA